MSNKLRAYWGRLKGSKTRELIFDGPSKPDMRLICQMISEDVLKELETRGYDLTTLKFEIKRKEQTNGEGKDEEA